MSLFPLAAFDVIEEAVGDRLLVEWGHWLEGCNRPFGKHYFGLSVLGVGLVSVAVSASTVNAKCAGWARGEVVELARCASAPPHRWATRVCLRLWREIAPGCWSRDYWPVKAAVSYQNAIRHSGNLYRFDGWRKVKDVAGGVAGGNWSRGKRYDPKAVWEWVIDPKTRRERWDAAAKEAACGGSS